MKNVRGFWNKVEYLFNRTPHLVYVFMLLTVVVMVASSIIASYQPSITYKFIDPTTLESSSQVIWINNYLSFEKLQPFLLDVLSNFTRFTSLFSVIVVLMAFGVAEKSGFIYVVFKGILKSIPKTVITFLLAVIGISSSLFSNDVSISAFIILLPIAAFVFMGTDRNPLAGIAMMFASVFGGYGINAVLSTSGYQLLEITASVSTTSNITTTGFNSLYINITLLAAFALTITAVTHSLIENILPHYDPHLYTFERLSISERKGVIIIIIFTVIYVILSIVMLIPRSVLDIPIAGTMIGEYDPLVRSYWQQFIVSPFAKTVTLQISLYLLLAGAVYGVFSEKFAGLTDIVKSMTVSVADNAEFFVIAFFCTQYLYILNDSGVGYWAVITLTNFAVTNQFGLVMLIVITFIVAAIANLFIPVASVKWGIMAPIIIPVFALYSINPVYSQMVYSVGESATNTIALVLPFTIFTYVLMNSYGAKTLQRCGNGTYIKLTYPYAIALFFVGLIVLILWVVLKIPLAPGFPLIYT